MSAQPRYVIADGRFHRWDSEQEVPVGALVWRLGTRDWARVGGGARWWQELEDPAPVLEGFAQLLHAEPGHEPTLRALGAMVRAGRAAQRAATLLEHVLGAAAQWARLVDIRYDLLAVTDDPGARLRLRLRIAETLSAQLGEHAAAVSACREAHAVAPDDPDVRAALERIAARDGDLSALSALYPEASPETSTETSLLERCAAAEPGDLELRRRLGELYVADGDAARAIPHLEALGDSRALIPLYEQVGCWFDLCEIVDDADYADRPEMRKKLLEAHLATDGTDAGAWGRLAEVRDVLGDADGAFVARTERFRLAPDPRAVPLLLATAPGPARLAAALEGAAHVLPELHRRLGELYRDALGDDARAIEHFQAVDDRLALAELYERAERWADLAAVVDDAAYAHRPELRRRLLEARIEREGDDPALRARLGELLAAQGDADAGFAECARAFVSRPTAGGLAALEGVAGDRIDELLALVGAALEAAPDFAAQVDDAAFADRPTLRVRLLEARLEAEPDDPVRWARLAEQRAAMGDAAGAFDAWRVSFEAAPSARCLRSLEGVSAGRTAELLALLERLGARMPAEVRPAAAELYRRAGRWAALAEIADHADYVGQPEVRQRVIEAQLGATSGERRAELLGVLAEVRDTLGDADAAFLARAEAAGVAPTGGRLAALLDARGERPDEVAAALESALPAVADAGPIHQHLGELYRELGDVERALPHYEALGDELVMAELYERAERWDDLAALVDDVAYADRPQIRARLLMARIDGGEAGLWPRLAEVLVDADDPAGARGAWTHALDAAADDTARAEAHRALASLSGDDGEAFEHLRAAFDGGADVTAELARAYEARGDWAALAQLLDGAPYVPAHVDGALVLSALAEARGEPRAALGDLLAACVERPDDARFGDALGRFAAAAGAWAEAAACYEQLCDGRPAIRRRLARWYLGPLQTPDRAIRHLQAVLADAPDDIDARDDLEGALAETERTAELAASLGAGSPTPQRLRALAKLRADDLDDPEGAADCYERLIERVPDDLEATASLSRIYGGLKRWEDVVRVLQHEVQYLPDEAGAAQHVRIGEIREELLGDLDGALAAYHAALGLVPTQPAALAGLERCFTEAERWDELVALCRGLLAIGTPAVEVRRRLDWLADRIAPDTAVDAYREVLAADPGDVTAVRALERLCRDSARPADLAWAYATRLPAVTEAREGNALRMRLAAVLHEELDDVTGAIEALAPIPDHPPALATLANLYAAAGRWTEEVCALDRLQAVQDEPARRRRIAVTCERELGDVARAFAERAALFVAAPHDAGARGELGALAERTGQHAELARAYADAIPAARDHALGRELRLSLARVRLDDLGDAEGACAAWQGVLDEVDAADPTATSGLCAVYTETGRDAELAALLERSVATGAERLTVSLRLARLYADRLEQPGRAIDHLRAALEFDPRHAEALAALASIYADREAWTSLYDVRRRQVELADDPAVRRTLRVEAACLASGTLGRPRDAIAVWREVVEDAPDDVAALEALEALLTAEGLRADARTACSRVLALAETPSAHERMARLYDGAPEALPHWRIVAGASPECTDALWALWMDAQREERAGEVASLGERLLALAGADEPRTPPLLRAVARAHDEQGDPTAAISAWERLTDIEGPDVEAMAALEPLYAAVGDINALQALMAWKLTRADENEALRLRRRAAELHEGEGLHGRALDELLAVFDDRPDPTLVGALARLARATERWDEVRPRLERAVAVEPADAEARALLVERYEADGAWPELVELLCASESRGPLVRAARLQQERLDQPEAAAETWRRVRSLDSEDAEASAALEALWPRLLARADGEDAVALLIEGARGTESPAARRSLYLSAAEVLEGRLGQPDHAFALLSRAFREAPAEGELTDHLERLAEETLRWGELVGACEEVLPRLEGAQVAAVQRRRARGYEKTGDRDGASRAWRGVLDVEPDAADALTALTAHLEGEGRLAELLDVQARAATDAKAWREVAILAEERVGDLDRAVEAWREVGLGDPEAQAALSRLLEAADRGPELAALWAARLEGADDPRLRVDLGALYRELGRDDAAVACLEGAADHPEAAAQLAEIYHAAEAWEDCARVWEAAPPDGADAAFERAHVCLEVLADAERARRWLDVSLALDPDHRHALHAALALAERRCDWPVVSRHLERLVATAPDGETRAALLMRLAEVCQTRLEDAEAATGHLRAAVAADPGNLDVVTVTAQRFLAAERWAEAEPLLATLVVSGRGDANERASKHALHGLCAERMSQDDIALNRYRRGVELDITHRPALSGVARLAFRYEAWDEAFRAGQALLVHHGEAMSDDERADTLWRQGAIQAARGDADAGASFRRALEANPEHEASQEGLAALEVARRAAEDECREIEAARERAAEAAEAAKAEQTEVLAKAARDAEAAAIEAESAARRLAAESERAAAERMSAAAREIDATALAEAVSQAASARIAEVAAQRLAEAVTAARDGVVEAAVARALEAAREEIAQAARAGLAEGVAERVVSALEEDEDDGMWASEAPQRRWPVWAAASAVAVAGLALGLSGYLYSELRERDAQQDRARAAYGRLVDTVAQTQDRFDQLQAAISGGAESPVVARRDPENLADQITDLTLRDLEMRGELGQIERMLAGLAERQRNERKAEAGLKSQVAMLEGRLTELRAEQSDVQRRIAERLDANLHGIETALSRAGIDYEKMLTPDRRWTPRAATEGVAPAGGVGGPRLAADGGYVSPVPGEDTAMSAFGPRGQRHHDGVDIQAPIGTAVRSVAAGEVIHLQDMETWLARPKFVETNGRRHRSSGWRAGVYVEIRHGDGRVSRYMHLGSIAVGLAEGSKVSAGEVIGSVGRTAVEQSETHLHFELREAPTRDGERFGQALNPEAPPPGDAEFLASTSLLRAGSSALPPLPAPGSPGHLTARETRLRSLEKLLTQLPLAAPVDSYRVSSHFGKRVDPLTKEMSFHSGVDLPGRDRTEVRATAPGKVVHAGEMGRYGTLVEIDHGHGIRTRYGHLHKAMVHLGQRVGYRDRVGLMGSTGRSTGTHLHYEVSVDGKPRDPLNFIQAGRFVFKR